MALSANRHSRMIVGDVIELPVYTGVHIYAGGFVCVNTGHGYAIPGADAASNICIGIAESEADNTSGASGDITVRVRRTGVFLMNATSIAITSQGVVMYLQDDQTFDETSAGNAVKCGVLVKYVSATSGWIDIGRVTTP
jgi:predicted RecA/RadA family phage recombinase